ncbi:peptidyl-trna hydrolase domain-containing protein [Apiospora phragmitis]|uniref:Peptidyl-trna hydrolase domain-containing protein n=1 Tax=Apiospora phragmitis TaxID=2905665 RepID=A0ABR1TWE5_9PEZI
MFWRPVRLSPSLGFSFSLAGRTPYRSFKRPAIEDTFDQDELEEARRWYASFNESSLPKGQTSYSRSSGPGGQHVNKTESKATTVWSVKELIKGLPKLMHPGLRPDAEKPDGQHGGEPSEAFRELQKIYRERVPGETSEKRRKKIEALEKQLNEKRLNEKKWMSAKKASRKTSSSD